MTGLGELYYRGQTGEGLPTFGLVLSAMALLGLLVSGAAAAKRLSRSAGWAAPRSR